MRNILGSRGPKHKRKRIGIPYSAPIVQTSRNDLVWIMTRIMRLSWVPIVAWGLAVASCQFSANLEGGPYWPCPENGECRAGCSCLDGQVCVPDDPDRPAAVCAWCAPGTLDCDGDPENGCEVRPMEDPEHCGGCGISCGQNAVCQGGDCKCLAGWGDCFNGLDDGCETRLVDNDDYCRGCNRPCDQPPASYCKGGQTLVEYAVLGECAGTACSYPQDSTFCPNGCEDGRCLDDPCGDVYCQDDEECVDGACVCVADDEDHLSCDESQRCCDGQCVLRFDNEDHCGACDNPCGPNQHCAELECTCDHGWGDCDTSVDNGCETDTSSDSMHCGECNLPCTAVDVCCDGECVDIAADPNHCGVCGNACVGDKPCIEERCGRAGVVACGLSEICRASDDMYCCLGDDFTSLGCDTIPGCSDGKFIYCDGPEDCDTTQVCCFMTTGTDDQDHVAWTQCKDSDECGDEVLCSSDRDCVTSDSGTHCGFYGLGEMGIYACSP